MKHKVTKNNTSRKQHFYQSTMATLLTKTSVRLISGNILLIKLIHKSKPVTCCAHKCTSYTDNQLEDKLEMAFCHRFAHVQA
jgi:hypothetical protein